MSITIPPSVSADSYVALAVADAYHATRLNVDLWDSANEETKESALKMATRRLEAENWKGLKTHSLASNILRWPRSDLYNDDGQIESSTTVPIAVQHATAELALEMLKAAADELAGAQSKTSEIQVGPVKLKLDTDQTNATSVEELSGDVENLIARYRNSTAMTSLVRA